MYLIKAGIDSDFGRIVVNATAFNLSHSYKDKTKEIKANGLLENSMLSLTYMRRVKSWNQVSLLLGMGPMIYTGGSVMTPLKSLTPELYGLQGIGEFEYSFYRSNLFRLTINAGLMLNGVIPKSYKE